MSAPTPCRLFVDPPAPGAWNMAVDEALLEQAANEGVASLRFYQWNEPTLSLGYFQAYAERDSHPPSRNAAVVRRLSGGGALMHDRELTYSLCLPANEAQSRQPAQLYGLVHRALIETFADWSMAARLYHDLAKETATPPKVEGDSELFLCFQRRTPDDVVLARESSTIAPAKITGSAQRRRRGAVLQHGAVLLERSPCAPELPGIKEIAGRQVTPEELIAPWRHRLAQSLHVAFSGAETTTNVVREDAVKFAEKFGSPRWNSRR